MTGQDDVRVERCDICVVGTGATGGLLAYRLAMDGLSVSAVSVETCSG